MNTLCSCLLLIVSLFSFAQKNISSERFAQTITPNDLKKHLYIIAGKEMEGRETATEGQRKAAAYIENYFKQTGRQSQEEINAFQAFISPQQFYISESVARTIIQDYSTAKSITTSIKTYNAAILLEVKKHTSSRQSSNVLGMIEGSDLKDEYLFITAHYDHLGKKDNIIYYGADDDGSGTVAILELAEAFAKAKTAGKGPRRSIVFMAVSGEEKGLLGSEYYTAHPTFPLNKTTANLNIDMIGRSDPKRTYGDSVNYVYVIGDDKLSSELRTISEAVNKKYTKLELDYKYNDPNDKELIYYRSDHYNFAKNGVPIIFYFNGTHADYHKLPIRRKRLITI